MNQKSEKKKRRQVRNVANAELIKLLKAMSFKKRLQFAYIILFQKRLK